MKASFALLNIGFYRAFSDAFAQCSECSVGVFLNFFIILAVFRIGKLDLKVLVVVAFLDVPVQRLWPWDSVYAKGIYSPIIYPMV